MDEVLRTIAVYLILLVVFRLTGKRTLAQATSFDLVIVLVVGEATAQALLGEDFSVTRAAIVIVTLVMLQRGSDWLAWRWKTFDKISEGAPSLLISDGEVLSKELSTHKLRTSDIMEAARDKHGLERLEQIKWAVLEKSGDITVVPRDEAAAEA